MDDYYKNFNNPKKGWKEWNEDQGLTWIVCDWTFLAIPYWNGVVLVLGENNTRITQCHVCKGDDQQNACRILYFRCLTMDPLWYCPSL